MKNIDWVDVIGTLLGRLIWGSIYLMIALIMLPFAILEWILKGQSDDRSL